MSWESWLIFVPAAFALSAAPGPNNMLAMTNALQVGLSRAVIAGGGRLLAFALMIALTAVGLGAVLAASETAFYVIKWCGAAYLVYLGIRMWRRRDELEEDDPLLRANIPLSVLARREFLVAIGNPKAILIFTAFFPQFLNPAAPAYWQFFVMGVTFLVLEVAALSLYALSGRQASRFGRSAHGRRMLNRISGGALIGAGVLLAASRRD